MDESQTMTMTERDCEELGRVVWHSSEEDGGPDVGRSIGLGDGWILWMGCISRSSWQEAGEDAAALGDDFGTWIILYGPKKGDSIVIGKAVDGYVGEDLLTRLSLAIKAAPSLPMHGREDG